LSALFNIEQSTGNTVVRLFGHTCTTGPFAPTVLLANISQAREQYCAQGRSRFAMVQPNLREASIATRMS
jgi:hypothetical protein